MKKLYNRLFLCSLLLLLGSFSVQAQVSGKVTDASTGIGLPGVSISWKGTGKGTLTDTLGRYTLQEAPGAGVLVFSFMGRVSQEVTLNGRKTINVQLADDKRELTEAVVIGYGTQKKKDLTGSISTISSKDFQQGNIQTPEQLIAGKVAGVSITSNSGQPGVGSTIRIRGGSSINGSNDPLIVIDGLPLSGFGINNAPSPMSLINPDDIETFTVLKDAAATAIYGSRASNGVILITTKKGKGSQPKFNFNTQVSVGKVSRRIPVLSADQIRAYVDSQGTATQKTLVGAANTDWQHEIYRPAVSTNHNLSMSGALKNLPYRLSAGYMDQNGTLITDKLQRVSAAINLNPRYFDNHLKVELNVKGSYTKSHFANQQAIINAVQFDPTQPVHDTASPFGGYFEWYTKDKNTGVASLNANAPRNPVSLIKLQDNNGTAMRSLGNIQLDYKFHFLPELHANLNLGYDVSKGKGTVFVPDYAGQSYTDNPATRGVNNHSLQTINNKVGEFYLNYNKDLTGIKSNVNVTAGYGYYDNAITNYAYPSFSANMDTIGGTVPNFAFDIPRNTLISYYGRLIYTFADKYVLAGSIRTDGSSRFSPETRWGVFPSAAFTWRINREAFLTNSRVLTDLKLRISYGVTGNQDGIANYSYLANYNISTDASQYQLGNTFYHMASPSAYDKNIKWEETATSNLGLDYGFFDGRLSGSVDVYLKKTKNLLNTVPIPVGSNFSNQILTNVGNIENKGIEIAINATAITTPKFTWDLGFNFTYNENKITNLTAVNDPAFAGNLTGGITGGTGNTIQIHSVGYNTFSYYVFKQVYDKEGRPIEGVYEDLNKDGVINQKDQYRYKSPAPKLMLGFTTQFSYRRWSLSTVLRANIGHYLYNNVASNFAVGTNVLTTIGILGNTTTDFYQTGFNTNQYQSDYYIQNASFLKMDNLNLSYNLGAFLHDHLRVRINAGCQNVFVITKYKGLDPEVSSGIDYNLYPRSRTFVLGANFDF